MKRFTAAASFAAVLAGWSAVPAFGSAPRFLPYQGKLKDAVTGTPLAAQTLVRFRLYQGGDDTTVPSTGALVYHETAVLTPSTEGIVGHLVGTGQAQTGCAETPCALTASDFPDASIPLYLEVMVDADGVLGSVDDDVLVPRVRLGTSGYAMHADTLDGMDSTEFARVGASQSFAGSQTFTRETVHSEGLTLGDGKAIYMSVTNPFPTNLGINHEDATFLDCNGDGTGDIDHVISLATYNIVEGTSSRLNPDTYAFKDQWELTYCGYGTPNGYSIERNEDFFSRTGLYRRFWEEEINTEALRHRVVIHALGNRDYAFNFANTGNLGIGKATPLYDLDIGGYDSEPDGTSDRAGRIRVVGRRTFGMGALYLGREDNPFLVGITAKAPTANRTVTFPDVTGQVAMLPGAPTHGLAAWALASGPTCSQACAAVGANGCVDTRDLAKNTMLGNCESTANARLCFCS